MQLVADKYYYWFTRVLTAASAVLLAASAAEAFMPRFAPYGIKFGLSAVTLVLAAVFLLYRLLLYRFILNKTNLFNAAILGCFIFMMNLVNLIHSTGRLHSWYHAIWITLVFMGGIFGPLAIVGFCFLTLLYMLLITTDIPGQIALDALSMIAAVAVFIIGALAYFIWRRLYMNQESIQVARLSGQLKSKQQQAEILIQSITDGMIVITTDGKISLMNPTAATMTGWSIDEASGIDSKLVIKLLKEDGKELEADSNPFVKVFSEQKPVNETMQLVNKDGKSIIVSLVISPVILPKSQTVSGAVAILRDISAQKAEEARRADFISTASHEMRTPVAAIEGYLALALNDKVSSIDTKARSYLEKAHSSTQHLGKLFQDLLTSAKAEDGRLVSHPVVVEMGSYLEQLTDSLRFSAEKKGLLMDFTIGTGGGETASGGGLGGGKVIKPLYYVHVDPDRLREVVTNLFDNGVKYTETGKISVGLTGNKDVVQLYIKDTGPGIPAEDIPHLFQKFYRVDSSATRTIGGTGLGLFICRKIIELYNGRIWVESEVDKGSIFYINLPRIDTRRASDLQAAEAAQLPTLTTPTP